MNHLIGVFTSLYTAIYIAIFDQLSYIFAVKEPILSQVSGYHGREGGSRGGSLWLSWTSRQSGTFSVLALSYSVTSDRGYSK